MNAETNNNHGKQSKARALLEFGVSVITVEPQKWKTCHVKVAQKNNSWYEA